MRRVGITDVLFYIIIVAIIAPLVRPGSKAGQALVDVIDAFAAVVAGATGANQQGGRSG